MQCSKSAITPICCSGTLWYCSKQGKSMLIVLWLFNTWRFNISSICFPTACAAASAVYGSVRFQNWMCAVLHNNYAKGKLAKWDSFWSVVSSSRDRLRWWQRLFQEALLLNYLKFFSQPKNPWKLCMSAHVADWGGSEFYKAKLARWVSLNMFHVWTAGNIEALLNWL